MCELLDKANPDDPLWWVAIRDRFHELIEKSPGAEYKLFEIVREHPKHHTMYWDVVERLCACSSVRDAVLAWLVSLEPNVFTAHILSKYLDCLDESQKLRVLLRHTEAGI